MPKLTDATTAARAAFAAAESATATATAHQDTLASRHAGAVEAVEAARAAVQAAEADRAGAIRDALAVGADPTAAAAAARDHRLRLAAEAEDAEDVAAALAAAIAEAGEAIRAARVRQEEAGQALRVAEAAELRAAALPLVRRVQSAWRAHAEAYGLPSEAPEYQRQWYVALLAEAEHGA